MAPHSFGESSPTGSRTIQVESTKSTIMADWWTSKLAYYRRRPFDNGHRVGAGGQVAVVQATVVFQP